MRYEKKRKPRKCPKCGGHSIADILYGMPDFAAIEKKLDAGEIVLGGCCISEDDPTWQCVDCECDIYRAEKGDA